MMSTSIQVVASPQFKPLIEGLLAKFSTAFILVLTIAFAGCSGKPKRGGEGTFKVALLTPGPISDKSWNGGAYAGLLEIRDSLGAEISHIQTRTPAEFDENFRQYGSKGFDLVFGHGFEFQDAALRVAPGYPGTTFVTTSGNSVASNVAGVDFAFEEASYLAGMVAGRLTRSNLLGVIGGTELPPVKRSFDAFKKGAQSVNPKAQVVVSYLGNWDDVSAGKEQAIAQISRGADIIFQNADAAGLGVFQAVKEATGVRIIGSNSNQNDLAPERTIGSVVIDLPGAFLLVAREVKKGNFTGKVYHLGLRNNLVTFVPNPRFQDPLPPDLVTAVEAARKRMIEDLQQ